MTVNSKRGFSLLEVIVALAIFAVGAAAVFGLYAVAMRSHQRAVNMRTAALVAEQAFDRMRICLATGVAPPTGDVAVTGLGRDVRYSLAISPLDSERVLWLVTVTVKWKVQGKDQQEAFKTVMTRTVPN